MVKKHGWFVTLNNPTDDELELCKLSLKQSVDGRRLNTLDGEYSHLASGQHVYSNRGLPIKGLAYFGFAEEVGKEKGVPHIHCVVVFKRPKAFTSMKKLFPRANIQNIRGNYDEAITYIRKDGRFFDTAFVPKEQVRQYITNDNQLAHLALAGDTSLQNLQLKVDNLETKLDRLIDLISQKKILNTLSDSDIV